MADGVVVFAAARACITHGPFAAPAVVKQAASLLPQKQFVASPASVHGLGIPPGGLVKQTTAASHNARSAGSARTQHPLSPSADSGTLAFVQVSQSAVGVPGSWSGQVSATTIPPPVAPEPPVPSLPPVPPVLPPPEPPAPASGIARQKIETVAVLTQPPSVTLSVTVTDPGCWHSKVVEDAFESPKVPDGALHAKAGTPALAESRRPETATVCPTLADVGEA